MALHTLGRWTLALNATTAAMQDRISIDIRMHSPLSCFDDRNAECSTTVRMKLFAPAGDHQIHVLSLFRSSKMGAPICDRDHLQGIIRYPSRCRGF